MKTSIVITKTGKRNYGDKDVVNEVHSRTFRQSDKNYDRETTRFIELFGPQSKNKTKGDKDFLDSGVKISVQIRHFEDQVEIPFESNLGL